MGSIKQYRKWRDENPLLHAKMKEEQRLTQIWYSKMSGQLSWLPGEKEENARQSDQVAREIEQIIGFSELHAGPTRDQ